MKKIFTFSTACLLLASCGNKSKKDYLWTSTFEISGKDTINITDGDGKKQGVWLIGTKKDTVVYLNDTAFSVPSGTPTKEIIQMLRNKRGYIRY